MPTFKPDFSPENLRRQEPGYKRAHARYWAGGEQEQVNPYSSQYARLGAASAGAIGLGFGFSALNKTGINAWDHIYNVTRTLEEFSPSQFARTYGAGDFLSQFTTRNKAYRHISAEEISGLTQSAWFKDIVHRTGTNAFEAINSGLTFKDGQLWAGDQLLLKHARVMTSWGTPNLAAAYSRAAGYEGLSNVNDSIRLGKEIPFSGTFSGAESFYFTGADSKSRAVFNQFHGIGTEWIERANRLAESPFEFEPFATSAHKAKDFVKKHTGLNLSFAVKSGPMLPTLGRMITKWGLLGSAAALGYSELDYQTRNAEILDGTMFAEGITAGVASTGIRASQFMSSLADSIPGLRSYQAYQEEVAPGSTSLTRLAGLPLGFAFAGLTAGYTAGAVDRVVSTRKFMKEGLTYAEALGKADVVVKERDAKFAADLFDKVTFGKFKDKKIPYIGSMGKLKRLGFMGGAIGLTLAAPFIPGALIPENTREELDALYSGEKEVAVRKGRFWEMGKCLIKTNTYRLFNETFKTSDQIEIGDILIGRNYEPAQVINIFTRHHTGEIIKFRTAFDRTIYTGMTANHIVPVYRENKIVEIPASDIKLNDLIEIPYRKLDKTFTEINSSIITQPVFIQDNKVYSAQINWFTGKLQKSGKHSIPRKIELDFDLGLLFGYFLAEGNISFKNTTPQFLETVHAKHEFEYVQDIERIVLEKFNTKISYDFSMRGAKAKEGCWIVRICSSILAKLFRAIFYQESYLAKDKHIPDFLLNSPDTFKQGLIEGYWRGDGHLDNNTRVITSARKHLLEQIQVISLDLNLPCGISKHHDSETFPSWRLRYYRNSSTSGVIKKNNKFFTRVKEITIEEYDDLVYDFEVDDKDHLLLAGTFLVHNSPYEGGQIEYFKQHWYAEMMNRGREKSLGIDDTSPTAQWFKENFTYDFEREHYRDRPYPQTGRAFYNIPIVGPILSATLGELFKPVKYMHTDEWQGSDSNVLRIPSRQGDGLDPTIDQLPGTPISNTALSQTFGDTAYRLQDLTGLAGFTLGAVKSAITGSEEWFDQKEVYQSADRAYGAEREFWDLSLGGVFGLSEGFRRLLPHRRRQIDEYNPIRNDMPSWLPGPGDKSEDFLHGDPYIKIARGETRLPGAGFATRFKELEGVDPEDYSSVYKYKILSDIAPYSESFKNVARQVKSDMKRGVLSEREQLIFLKAKEQLIEKKNSRKNFFEYTNLTNDEFADPEYEGYANTSKNLLTAINKSQPKKDFSILGAYWEGMAGLSQTPTDFATPIAPASKLMHLDTAIQDYRKNQVHGKEIAMWDKPFDNFIAPFLRESANMIGGGISVPQEVSRKRQIESYFDVLKYVKNTQLANISKSQGQYDVANSYQKEADQTLFGINPYTQNLGAIFRSLPKSERDYFMAFSNTTSAADRSKIMEMVPDNEKRLYKAQWELKYQQELKRQMKEGLLGDSEFEEAELEVARIDQLRRTEGLPVSDELMEEYRTTRASGQKYSDWYKTSVLLPEIAQEVGLPGADFVGWDPRVDLEDIKLKVVQNEGLDKFQFNLWQNREKAAAYKPYLDEAAEDLEQPLQTNNQTEIENLLAELNLIGQVTYKRIGSSSDDLEIHVELKENREEELDALLAKINGD